MKAVKLILGLILAATLTSSVAAQVEIATTRDKVDAVKTDSPTKTDTAKPVVAETPAEIKKNAPGEPNAARQQGSSDEESSILPYYNNYLTEYRLGPEDVITVEVFGQCPDYCKTGITIPPTARISYPLIREGVFVGGKSIEQVQDEITKKLDEYIIDPKVTVTIEKVGSARYSVLGKVALPGVRLMTRRLSVYEAVVESGGVLKEGDRKRVVVYRQTPGGLTQIAVNLQEVERGKAEMIYLVPGDQVFVPDAGFKLNVDTVFKVLEKASIVRFLFGSPF